MKWWVLRSSGSAHAFLAETRSVCGVAYRSEQRWRGPFHRPRRRCERCKEAVRKAKRLLLREARERRVNEDVLGWEASTFGHDPRRPQHNPFDPEQNW